MTKEMYCHHELLWMIDGYEPERGTRVAGHRGYFLKGNAVLLNQAIIMYAMHWNNQRGFTTLQTPYFMNKDVMAGVAQLEELRRGAVPRDRRGGRREVPDRDVGASRSADTTWASGWTRRTCR